MSFRITSQHGQARCGILSSSSSNSTTTTTGLLTPCFTEITNCGSLLNLVDSVFNEQILSHNSTTTTTTSPAGSIKQLNTFELLEMTKSIRGHPNAPSFRKYINFPSQDDNNLLFASIRHPIYHTTLGASDEELTGPTVSGNRKITPKEFIEMMKYINPDFFVCISDEVGSFDGVKRKAKSVKRSLDWLDRCIGYCSNTTEADNKNNNDSNNNETIDTSKKMIVSIQGTNNLKDREKSAVECAKRNVFGFAIGGLWMGENEEERNNILNIIIQNIPSNKIRFIPGATTPFDILDSILLGFDLFEGSYVNYLTTNGYAAVFPISENSENIVEKNTGNFVSKIQLFDKQYSNDLSPILNECPCFTCKSHSRAYLHHLVECREMTANILLDIHNSIHFRNFFDKIREEIKNETFHNYVKWFKSNII